MFWTFIIRFCITLGTVVFLVYISLRFSGSWKNTTKKVIKRYAECKQQQPNYSDQEIFFTVLDARYPNNPATKHLHKEKEKIKEKIIDEIKTSSSMFKKYNLPTLILCCLIIERNTVLRKKDSKGIKQLLKDIEDEVKKQGFEQYI